MRLPRQGGQWAGLTNSHQRLKRLVGLGLFSALNAFSTWALQTQQRSLATPDFVFDYSVFWGISPKKELANRLVELCHHLEEGVRLCSDFIYLLSGRSVQCTELQWSDQRREAFLGQMKDLLCIEKLAERLQNNSRRSRVRATDDVGFWGARETIIRRLNRRISQSNSLIDEFKSQLESFQKNFLYTVFKMNGSYLDHPSTLTNSSLFYCLLGDGGRSRREIVALAKGMIKSIQRSLPESLARFSGLFSFFDEVMPPLEEAVVKDDDNISSLSCLLRLQDSAMEESPSDAASATFDESRPQELQGQKVDEGWAQDTQATHEFPWSQWLQDEYEEFEASPPMDEYVSPDWLWIRRVSGRDAELVLESEAIAVMSALIALPDDNVVVDLLKSYVLNRQKFCQFKEFFLRWKEKLEALLAQAKTSLRQSGDWTAWESDDDINDIPIEI